VSKEGSKEGGDKERDRRGKEELSQSAPAPRHQRKGWSSHEKFLQRQERGERAPGREEIPIRKGRKGITGLWPRGKVFAPQEKKVWWGSYHPGKKAGHREKTRKENSLISLNGEKKNTLRPREKGEKKKRLFLYPHLG